MSKERDGCIYEVREDCMKKSCITPNSERIRESYVHAVQTTWVDYIKAYKEWLDSIWYNNQGQMCMYHTEEYKNKANKAEEAHHKAVKELNDFDTWVRVEKKLKGESYE